MSKSNWEDAKKRSNYHFNNDIIDKNNIKHIGKFIGSWKKEVDEVINDAKKLNWSNRRASTDRPNNDVQAEENDLINAGADPKMTIYRGLTDFSKCKTIQKISEYWGLDKLKAKMHVQFTGEVLNMHIDKLYDLDDDPNNVIRIMIMLDDWQPGQFLIYGNQVFDRWESGHIHYFDWQNLPHATANASLYPRPMLVLTGVMTDRTRELIKVQSNHYLI